MRKFQFKFSTVLKVKKRREEEALLTLAATQRSFQSELEKKAHLVAELEKSLQRREQLGSTTTRISDFLSEQDYIVGNKNRIIQSDQAIFRAGRWVEKALRAYLAARTQTRVLETLRDQGYGQYRKEVAKREQKELDDLILMRHRLKSEEVE